MYRGQSPDPLYLFFCALHHATIILIKKILGKISMTAYIADLEVENNNRIAKLEQTMEELLQSNGTHTHTPEKWTRVEEKKRYKAIRFS